MFCVTRRSLWKVSRYSIEALKSKIDISVEHQDYFHNSLKSFLKFPSLNFISKSFKVTNTSKNPPDTLNDRT